MVREIYDTKEYLMEIADFLKDKDLGRLIVFSNLKAKVLPDELFKEVVETTKDYIRLNYRENVELDPDDRRDAVITAMATYLNDVRKYVDRTKEIRNSSLLSFKDFRECVKEYADDLYSVIYKGVVEDNVGNLDILKEMFERNYKDIKTFPWSGALGMLGAIVGGTIGEMPKIYDALRGVITQQMTSGGFSGLEAHTYSEPMPVAILATIGVLSGLAIGHFLENKYKFMVDEVKNMSKTEMMELLRTLPE